MPALAQVAGADPVVPEGAGQQQGQLLLARLGQAELQRGAQVGVGQSGPLGGLRLPRAEPLDLAPGGHPEVPVPVAPAQALLLAARPQPAGAVLAQGVQQPVAGAERALLPQQHRLGDQLAHQVEEFLGGQALARAHVLDRLQVEAAGEDREPGPEQTFLRRAELMTPADRGAQRAVPLRAAARTADQQPEAVVQPVGDLLHRERPQPPGGQLHRERDAVQPAAEPGGLGQVALGQLEARQHGGGPVGEQPHRRRDPARLRRHRQRRQGVEVFARDPEHLPAGGQHPQPGGGPQQRGGQCGAGLHQVFAAVQHQQQLPVGQLLDQHLLRLPGGGVGQSQRLQHRVAQQVRAAHPGQLHQPHPVGVPPGRPGRGAQGQPGLADPAGAGHRHQPTSRQQLVQIRQFGLPADEAGQLGGQPVAG
ncbi:hypothetical protein [Kitasatospora albolonga]|uniref:hypothetical protein n=1 Tax=Kitasatospora albolonga TaxID=68173 RepID=UPI0031ED61A1